MHLAIHVISDSVGVTAQAVARAAASQFGVNDPVVEVLSKAANFEEIRQFLELHSQRQALVSDDKRLLLFYTLVDEGLRTQLQEYLAEHPHIVSVDLLTDAVNAIAYMTGLQPLSEPGALRIADQAYFRRIAALEFTIAHDDGRNPQDLAKADIVLVGVSRSGKTPISIYLSQQGFRVANVPLDLVTEPPKELYTVDKSRLFGLVIDAQTLVAIRRKRFPKAAGVAASYSDVEQVYRDLEQARALMRSLGCIVIHTENRAVEETAQEILRYYEIAHPVEGVMEHV